MYVELLSYCVFSYYVSCSGWLAFCSWLSVRLELCEYCTIVASILIPLLGVRKCQTAARAKTVP